MRTIPELFIMLGIAIFIIMYRNNKNGKSYKEVLNKVENIYDKYAPYSFKVVREKTKELGQEFTAKQYIMQVVLLGGFAALIGYFYFYSITNPMRGAKIDTNMSAMLFDSQQGAFYDTVDVVSLDKKDEMIEEGCMYFALQDLISFPILQKYQKEQELSYEQVVEIEQALTKNFMDEEVQIIGSKLQ